MIEAWNIKVSGRVQGVGYRFSAQRQARRLGLSGWVRNEYDGSVRLFVQGESMKVSLFIQWLSRGPSMSQVRDVQKTPTEPDNRSNSFEITF